ncbi:GT4 family glycosyltransferase PelF [Jeongeupia chitinilytica]|uniref:Pellicle/biofilm biosynthesis glycosyltransferase PelF n=1 Tax=Jeongeupia chitinilytica TaxID=1041641 RepID=A0ABQ3H444_9NEIS|nr:GT4 family glycosyltransferase PelF [Jeongeupia chitinilytica]GHD64127.1 pellicle/biofilm biosynthesis glycosyltransferase PelF [Jeongeupia chitinilytica]
MSGGLPKLPVDVCLLLEGTFPYVSGGVSSWVNQIIRGFPQLSFGIVFLGSRRDDYGDMKYTLPDNVAWLSCHYLHDIQHKDTPRARHGDEAEFAAIAKAHAHFRTPNDLDTSPEAVERMLERLFNGVMGRRDFLFSEVAWNFICEQYRQHSTDPSFVDYFWTVRAMHAPVWLLAELAANLPPARLYHTVSTGYAGFLGALLKQRTGAHLLLSEHGIYTKERKIDLYQSDWIRDNRNVFEREASRIGYFRELWIRFFEQLGRQCYHAADDIVALYEANRQRQIRDGADAARTRAVSNGIDLARLAPLRAQRGDGIPPVLCLIGRVVPIKDIKTFIRAMRTVVNRRPDAEAWIAGPEDESPDYANECRELVVSLGLTDKVRFLGFQRIDALLPKIGVVVLSSISEALPLVLLEGYAAGVPAVATDVGSCHQLVYGQGQDDEALGASGRIVGVADPRALADAAVELLEPAHWYPAQAAGIARVERYYTQTRMFDSYRELYAPALTGETA